MQNRLVSYLCVLWKRNDIVIIYLSIGYLCKCDRRLCLPMVRKQLRSGQTPRNPIGSMTVSMGIRIRFGVFGLNLRLASLVLATINTRWFQSSGTLIGSVYTSSRFIENCSVLDVMSRWKYHLRHMEMMITWGFGTSSLLCCNHRDNMTRSGLSDSKRLVRLIQIVYSITRDIRYWITIRNTTVYYA